MGGLESPPIFLCDFCAGIEEVCLACGSVFQTGLPFRQESEGLKTPGY